MSNLRVGLTLTRFSLELALIFIIKYRVSERNQPRENPEQIHRLLYALRATRCMFLACFLSEIKYSSMEQRFSPAYRFRAGLGLRSSDKKLYTYRGGKTLVFA